jgi:hypothetical protein
MLTGFGERSQDIGKDRNPDDTNGQPLEIFGPTLK